MEQAWRPGEHIQDWHASERAIVHAMQQLGYPDAAATSSGSDGGFDVKASGAIGEVKMRSAQIGRPLIQRLVGAREDRHDISLFYFSASGFSRPAIEYATRMDVALFVFDVRGFPAPISPAAEAAVLAADMRRKAERRAIAAQSRAKSPGKPIIVDRWLQRRVALIAGPGVMWELAAISFVGYVTHPAMPVAHPLIFVGLALISTAASVAIMRWLKRHPMEVGSTRSIARRRD